MAIIMHQSPESDPGHRGVRGGRTRPFAAGLPRGSPARYTRGYNAGCDIIVLLGGGLHTGKLYKRIYFRDLPCPY